jgi:hypothetical protein
MPPCAPFHYDPPPAMPARRRDGTPGRPPSETGSRPSNSQEEAAPTSRALTGAAIGQRRGRRPNGSLEAHPSRAGPTQQERPVPRLAYEDVLPAPERCRHPAHAQSPGGSGSEAVPRPPSDAWPPPRVRTATQTWPARAATRWRHPDLSRRRELRAGRNTYLSQWGRLPSNARAQLQSRHSSYVRSS